MLGIFLILLLLGAGLSFGLFFFWPSPQTPQKQKVLATNPNVQALVNKHLWLTTQTQEMQQKQRELENGYSSVQVGDSIWPRAKAQNKNLAGVDHSADRNENTAYEDLNRYPKQYELSNPENVIQGQISDQNLKNAYAEQYRAEYAKQFVENARRHGYKVELNSDYVVIRVTPIVTQEGRAPSTFSIPSGPQAQ